MIINFDMPSSIETYKSRLTTYATNNTNTVDSTNNKQKLLVVTFFNLDEHNNNIEMANELVHVLKGYGQKVPRELIKLVQPPPLMSPSWKAAAAGGGEGSGSGSGENVTGSRGRPRPLNAVPVREDSHSPAPDVVGGAQQQQRRQRQFLMSSSNNSSDDDESSSQNINNETTPSGGSGVLRNQPSSPLTTAATTTTMRPNPVRRIRHAEVVLVDQCLIIYGRTWLRLRWPGEQGGFGGFVALSRIEDMVGLQQSQSQQQPPRRRFKSDEDGCGEDEEGSGTTTTMTEYAVEGGGTIQEIHHHPTTSLGGGVDSQQQQQQQQSSTSTTMLAASTSIETPLLCQETTVHYPTSNDFMKLLPLYDDGLKGVILDNGSDDVPEGVTDDLLMGENGEVRSRTLYYCVCSFDVIFISFFSKFFLIVLFIFIFDMCTTARVLSYLSRGNS